MRRALLLLALLAVGLLAFAARAQNVREVFVEGRIYFTDADCYARMTRVRVLLESHTWFLAHHDFENWPQGTTPHTTAPLDWAIVGVKGIADYGLRIADWGSSSVLRGQTLDLAGALVSPLLGVLTCAWLGGWAWREVGAGRALAVALFFAVSPILVHGTLLGRPDHQSLLIFLLAVALSAEVSLGGRAEVARWRGPSLLAGAAWGLALWVSLYEPALLLGVVLAFWLVADRRRFLARECRAGWLLGAAIFGLSLLGEGWRVAWPDATLRTVFAHWQQTIGELGHLDPRAPLLYRWLGWLIVPAPVLLWLVRRDRRAALLLVLLAAAFGLTVWQLRWGYFLALIFALSLPWLFIALRRAWIAWPIFLAALWPLALDWDEKLFPEDHPESNTAVQHEVQRLEAVRLREIAEAMRGPERRAFLAPWWLSPALAYWSGQPGVAGSSHESLPGIVESAQFFLAPDATSAEQIVQRLGVQWVVTDDIDRLTSTSRVLLGDSTTTEPYVAILHNRGQPPEWRKMVAGMIMIEPPISAADREAEILGSKAFSCVAKTEFFKLFSFTENIPKP